MQVQARTARDPSALVEGPDLRSEAQSAMVVPLECSRKTLSGMP